MLRLTSIKDLLKKKKDIFVWLITIHCHLDTRGISPSNVGLSTDHEYKDSDLQQTRDETPSLWLTRNTCRERKLHVLLRWLCCCYFTVNLVKIRIPWRKLCNCTQVISELWWEFPVSLPGVWCMALNPLSSVAWLVSATTAQVLHRPHPRKVTAHGVTCVLTGQAAINAAHENHRCKANDCKV